MAKGLNDKQRRFVQEYLKDLNGTQAAIRAGYAANSAYSTAERLLRNTEVRKFLKESKREISEACKVDAEYVLRRLHEIDCLDVMDILEEDMTVKPLKEWPKAWRTSISAIDVSRIFKASGDDEAVINAITKIKWPDKTRVLEQLGKHVDVQAFKERLEVEGELSISERMQRAVKRQSGD